MTLESQLHAQQIPLFESGDLLAPRESKRASSSHTQQVKNLAIHMISRNPWQPRIYFNPEAITELANNISQVGLLQPITVRKSPNGNCQYELISGERRLQAYKQLGNSHIPAILRDADDRQMSDWALSENTNRENLTDYEISLGIQRAEKEFPDRSRSELARAISIPRSVLYRYLAFQDLPLFIQDDLRINPTMMTNKVASELKAIFSFHGQKAFDQMRIYWKQVINGQLEASKLVEALKKALEQQDKTNTVQLKRNLQIGQIRVGSMTSDSSVTAIRIESKFIPESMLSELAEAVEAFLSKHQTI